MANEHRCGQCEKKFPHASILQRHLETHMITGDWLCALCNTLCNRLSALNHHWQHTCPGIKTVFCDDERKNMSCDDLQETAFRLTLDRHSLEKTLDEPGPSNINFDNEKSISSLCIYCNLYLPHGTLDHHYGVHTNRCSAGETCQNSTVSYVCDLCGFGFRFKKSLYHHWRHKCPEVLAQCPSQGMIIDNRQLKKMVEDLVKRAEVVAPMVMQKNRREEDVEKEYEEDDEQEDDDETKSTFSSRISPVYALDYQLWNIKNNVDPTQCSRCNRNFHSSGRLKHHLDAFHQNEKPAIFCELCQTKFKHNRLLMNHLRGTCKAMRVEEPDENKRKKMSRDELMEIVKNGKETWKELFDKKKAANIKFITEFLNEIDKKRPRLPKKVVKKPILNVPVPISRYAIESDHNLNTCGFCKITFNSPRFLYQHQQTVHGYEQQSTSRNQLTITASSLLPYFKLQEAVFYDLNGREYRMGKYLEKKKDLTKHLKDRIIETGTKLVNVEGKDCFVVELFGEKGHHILLNEQEFTGVCSPDGRLKTLFSENPKKFEDLPVLEKQV